ncbi:MAG: hypothetical protein ABIM40_01825 [Pseudomonadota bacterium]
MTKHSVSHAGAVLAGTITAGLLKDEVRHYVPVALDLVAKARVFWPKPSRSWACPATR